MALSYNTGLAHVVARYLAMLNVPFTPGALTSRLQENPYYPSLYSIKNVLDKFNVPNEAFTLKQEHWKELQPPFITYIKNTESGKDFVLVTAITADSVSFIHQDNKIKTAKTNDFIANWEKLILVAEPVTTSGDPEYNENFIKEKTVARKKQWLWIGAAALAVFLVAGFFIGLTGTLLLPATLISMTKLAGVVIAVLLLLYETDKSIAFVKNICTAGRQTNCDAVLNSKASGIAGIKWSEAGFFYFAATTLFLFYPSLSFAEKIPWLAGAATLVSPYIVFSIYYQYKVVKQWCPLCLAVQGVLLLELIWAITVYWTSTAWPVLTLSFAAVIVTCLLLPVVAWFFIKPLIGTEKQTQQFKAAYRRLLYNPEQFNQLLEQQSQAPDGWQLLGITVGNPAAQNTIIKVCNPYCGPCAKAHPELEEIIQHNNNIKLKVIFTATVNEKDRSYNPVKHLLAVDAKKDAALTQRALDDWYNAEKKDYDFFAAKYPMNGELKQQDEKINAMDNWCREAGIAATPTIFVNGYQLPENYTISELKNIL